LKAFCWLGGRAGEDGEGLIGRDRRDDGVAREGREVREQALETVDGKAVGRTSGGTFARAASECCALATGLGGRADSIPRKRRACRGTHARGRAPPTHDGSSVLSGISGRSIYEKNGSVIKCLMRCKRRQHSCRPCGMA
jgi:hypothetical protein